jgi:hypothetical protein
MTSSRKSRNPDRKPEEDEQERNQEGQVLAFLGKQVFVSPEGRSLESPRQVFVVTRRQVPIKRGAGPSCKMRQVSVQGLLYNRKTVSSWFAHRLLLTKQPVKR